MDPDPFEIVIRDEVCRSLPDTYLMVVKKEEKFAGTTMVRTWGRHADGRRRAGPGEHCRDRRRVRGEMNSLPTNRTREEATKSDVERDRTEGRRE